MSKGIPNVDSETGIAYGVIYGNSVPYLMEDIFSNGTDLSYEGFKEELKQKVTSALEEAIDDYCSKPADIVEQMGVDDIVESLLDSGLNDRYECDESEHEYSDGDLHIYQGWLGGAVLLWITKSKYVCYARGCSPCVPNGGDLDSISEDNDGALCYCLPPEGMLEHLEERGLTVETQPYDTDSPTIPAGTMLVTFKAKETAATE